MPETQKILVVEDEPSLLLAIGKKLRHEGFEVFEARDGIDGLALAFAKHPDFILLDIVMPKMDGLTMLGKLREDDWGKKVPVLILTNLVSAESAAQAEAHGSHGYLVKTEWTLEDVVKKIREHIGAS